MLDKLYTLLLDVNDRHKKTSTMAGFSMKQKLNR